MKHQLYDTHMVKPTQGLDIDKGVIMVLGIMSSAVVPVWAVEPYTQGLDSEDEFEIVSKPWFAFSYTDSALNKDWGIMYLPECEFERMTRD